MLCPCVSIRACKRSHGHLVTLKVDSAIFNAILSSLYKKTPLLRYGVYLTLRPLQTKTKIFKRLQNVLALISKHACHLVHALFSVVCCYNFKYLITSFHVDKIVSQLQSHPILMLLSLHFENLAQIMVVTLTPNLLSRNQMARMVDIC